MPTIQIPEDAAWYVKTGLDRAIREAKRAVELADKRLDHLQNLPDAEPGNKDDKFVLEFIAQTKDLRAYYSQWLREATAAYKTLPKELQPLAINE